MKLHNFRIAWRVMSREPVYAVAVVLGLSIGLAVCFLLLSYVHYSFTYDTGVPAADRVYVLKHRLNLLANPKWNDSMPLPARTAAVKSGLVTHASIFEQSQKTIKIGDALATLDLSLVDADFPSIFGIHTVAGDLVAAIARPDGIALTVSAARRLLSSVDVIGRTLRAEEKTYQVLAVIPDPPSNSTMPYEAIASKGNSDQGSWMGLAGKVIVRLADGVNPEELTGFIQEEFDHSPVITGFPAEQRQNLGGRKLAEVGIGRLRDAYFDVELASSNPNIPRGDKAVVIGIAAIAVLTLFLAAANYVNLATVRTLRRQREIGMRLVLGASPLNVVEHFLSESILVSSLATAVGLFTAWLTLPLFSDIVGRDLGNVFTIWSISAFTTFGILVGLIVGIYPALRALQVRPQPALAGRGTEESGNGLWVRRALTITQFATAMGLTALTITIGWQTWFAIRRDPGFDPTQLLVIDLKKLPKEYRTPAAIQSLTEGLTHVRGVSGVARSTDAVGRNSPQGWLDGQASRPNGSPFRMIGHAVNPEFFDVYGIKPLAGRLYDPARDFDGNLDKVVINGEAARVMGYAASADAVGNKVLWGNVPREIIGIAPEIQHRTLRDKPEPTIYLLDNYRPVVIIRVDGPIGAAETEIEKMWRARLPNAMLDLRRASSFFAQSYAEDLSMTRLLAGAALIAIALSCFGTYVLSAYTVQRRSREIALRKLHGATSFDIARLIAKEFGKLILIGAAIGLPCAWIVGEKYLSTFVERAPMGLMPLIIAILFALLITTAAVYRHVLMALRIRPVTAFRNA